MDTPTATLPAIARPDPGPEVARLAARWRRANGPLIALMNRLGGQLEAQVAELPDGIRTRIAEAVRAGLGRAMALAALGRHAPRTGPAGAPALAALAGAAGGAGGLPPAPAELPLTVTLILHAIAEEARAAGFDPSEGAVRAECLRVLGSGTPLSADDGVNTAFLGARLALTGRAVEKMLSAVAPALTAALARKLAAQAVPVLGAVTGAALNAAYLRHYRALAGVRFGLLRLAADHDPAAVAAAFARATNPPRLRRM